MGTAEGCNVSIKCRDSTPIYLRVAGTEAKSLAGHLRYTGWNLAELCLQREPTAELGIGFRAPHMHGRQPLSNTELHPSPRNPVLINAN